MALLYIAALIGAVVLGFRSGCASYYYGNKGPLFFFFAPLVAAMWLNFFAAPGILTGLFTAIAVWLWAFGLGMLNHYAARQREAEKTCDCEKIE